MGFWSVIFWSLEPVVLWPIDWLVFVWSVFSSDLKSVSLFEFLFSDLSSLSSEVVWWWEWIADDVFPMIGQIWTNRKKWRCKLQTLMLRSDGRRFNWQNVYYAILRLPDKFTISFKICLFCPILFNPKIHFFSNRLTDAGSTSIMHDYFA